MNRDYMANMLFNINDVVETIKGHSINNDIIEEYDESQFDETPKTLMDIPKDWEGSSITIGTEIFVKRITTGDVSFLKLIVCAKSVLT